MSETLGTTGKRAGRNLAPRHRLAFVGLRACLLLGRALPLPVLGHFGEQLGLAALRWSARYRNDALQHLQLALPGLAGPEHQALLRAMARHLGRVLAEMAWLQRAGPEQLCAEVAVDGLEHLQEARRRGRGAVLVSAHCGSWELLNARLAVAGMPLSIVVREVNHPAADRILSDLRTRFGSETVIRDHRAGRRLVRALLGNRVAGLLIDQHISGVQGVLVPFFGRPAWTPTGAAELAVRLGCPLVPAFIHRLPDHHHQVRILPPLVVPATPATPADKRVLELTAAATRVIEQQIRAHPEQWPWFHKRWRAQPSSTAAASSSPGVPAAAQGSERAVRGA